MRLMDLNTICIALLMVPVLYGLYIYYTDAEIVKPVLPPSLWGEQVGKSKLIQSKTGDASLFTQGKRRSATKNGGFARGFMQAAIDFYFISRICPCTGAEVEKCKCKCCSVFDGGHGNTLYTDAYDGGDANGNFGVCTLDGGEVVHGQTCACCPSTDGGQGGDELDAIYSGGNANTEFNGNNIDGGGV